MAYAPRPAGPKNIREMFHYLWRELNDIGNEIAPAQLSQTEEDWVRESTHLFQHYFATTTDNVWTEIARIPKDPDDWTTGYAEVIARRTDLPDRLLINADFNVWRDGAAPVAASSDAFSQAGGHPLMNFRVIGDGNDAVAQVSGFPGETWDWDLTYFTREVT